MKTQTYIAFFRTLSEPTKLCIIKELRKADCTVNALQEKLNLEQSRLSHSLKTLKEYGFVTSKRIGKHQSYSLEKNISQLLLKMDVHVDKYFQHAKACGCTKECGCIGKCQCGVNCN